MYAVRQEFLEVKLLGQRVCAFIILIDVAKVLSTKVVPLYIYLLAMHDAANILFPL